MRKAMELARDWAGCEPALVGALHMHEYRGYLPESHGSETLVYRFPDGSCVVYSENRAGCAFAIACHSWDDEVERAKCFDAVAEFLASDRTKGHVIFGVEDLTEYDNRPGKPISMMRRVRGE